MTRIALCIPSHRAFRIPVSKCRTSMGSHIRLVMAVMACGLSACLTGCASGIYTHWERAEGGDLLVTSRERYFLFGTFTANKDKVAIEPIGANIIPDDIISISIGAAQK